MSSSISRRMLATGVLAVGLLAWLAAQANATLVSEWKFNETSGTTAADSVGANSGTLVGGTLPTWGASGVFGGAVNLGGAGAVSVADDASMRTSSFTTSVWLNTSSALAYSGIVDKWDPAFHGYYMDYTSTQTQFRVVESTGAAQMLEGPLVNDGSWHLITGVVGPTAFSLYEDGQLQATVATALGPNWGPSSITTYFGGTGGHTNYLTGLLDDIGLWNNPLSAGEIKAVYDFGQSSTYHYDAGTANGLFASYEGSHANVTIGSVTWQYGTGLGSTAGLSGNTLVLDAATGAGFSVIPEPSTMALLISALVGLLAYAWRKRK